MERSFRLYHYWRSSCSWRVRWALALKKIQVEFVPVDLLNGETESETHHTRNPQNYVPVLEFLNPQAPFRYLSESIAIIEWLDETYPSPSLLPGDAFQRAKVRQLAEIVNSGTQPLQNPTVSEFHSEDPIEKKKWNVHWITKGLRSYEEITQETAGRFSVGNSVTVADFCLIPQIYNAKRQEIPLEEFPTLTRIFEAAQETDGFRASEPEKFKP